MQDDLEAPGSPILGGYLREAPQCFVVRNELRPGLCVRRTQPRDDEQREARFGFADERDERVALPLRIRRDVLRDRPTRGALSLTSTMLLL